MVALVFPNVGFALSTIYIGQELESNAILWVSVGLTILVVLVWLMVLTLMARHIWRSFALTSSKNA